MAVKKRKKETAKQRQARYEAARKRNEARVEMTSGKVRDLCAKFADSDNFKEYLVKMRRFQAECKEYLHSYSPRNLLLVMAQDPSASIVGSFQAWKKMGRPVQKGETAHIFIWVPTEYKAKKQVTDEDGNPVLDDKGEAKMEYVLGDDGKPVMNRTYIMGPVFDVSQTAGDPLPSMARELADPVENFEKIYDALVGISALPVLVDGIDGKFDLHGAKGYCRYGEHIVLKGDMSEAQTLKTLVHEIAHSRLHAPDDGVPVREKELQAEGTAYLVCEHLGLDTSDYSIPYVFSWENEKEEMSTFCMSLGVILEQADEISEKIDAALGTDDPKNTRKQVLDKSVKKDQERGKKASEHTTGAETKEPEPAAKR